MKYLLNILLVLVSFNSLSQVNTDYVSVSEKMNKHIYLLKNVWDYTQHNVVDIITINMNDTVINITNETSYKIKHSATRLRYSVFTIFFNVYCDVDSVQSVSIGDTTFNTKDCDISPSKNSKTGSILNDYLEIYDGHKNLNITAYPHKRFFYYKDGIKISYDKPTNFNTYLNDIGYDLHENEYDPYATRGEVASQLTSEYLNSDIETILKRSLYSYYIHSHKVNDKFNTSARTGHWGLLMSKGILEFNYISTNIIKTDNKIVSVSFLEQIKKEL